MAEFGISGFSISGIVAAVPAETQNNSALTWASLQEANAFIQKVGIQSRHISHGRLTTADLCTEAARQVLSRLGWQPHEVEIMVLVTQTPDYTVPPTSGIIQHRLGLSTSTICIDVNQGCTGWVNGLSVVLSLMQSTQSTKALLLCGETNYIAGEETEYTYRLMGDAGTATAITVDDNGAFTFVLNHDGSRKSAIQAPESGARALAEGLVNNHLFNHTVRMDSSMLMELCLRDVPAAVQQLLHLSDAGIDSTDYFVFHQANKVLNEAIRKKLNIPPERFPYSIADYGNTSSASIPLTMATCLSGPLTQHPLRLLCFGFGVGLSWGGVYVHTHPLHTLELIAL